MTEEKKTEKLVKKTVRDEEKISFIIELKDGHILSEFNDGTIKIWGENNLHCTTAFKSITNCPIKLEDGGLVSGSDDNKIKIWK